MKILGYALITALILTTLTACGSDTSPSAWPTSSQVNSVAYVQSVAFRNHTAMGWGNNGFGQLGNGSSGNSLTPVPIAGLPKLKDIVTGGTHSLAFKNLSGVWAWGNNGYGQLGNGTVTASYVPVNVFTNISSTPIHVRAYLTNVTAVSAGGYHSLALDTLGYVWAWGANTWGQLGVPPNTLANMDARVVVQYTSTGWTATRIAAGGEHSLALDASGAIWAWGRNDRGQLGDNSTVNNFKLVQVSGITQRVVEIAAGGSHSLALLADGTVVSWGYNYYGQLGNNSTVDSSLPVQVVGLSGIKAIAAGLDHSLALDSVGNVWAWGYNASGQLGVGSMTSSPVAVKVSMPATMTSIERILAIGHHSLAFSGTSAWAWGDNSYGQLGVNSTANFLTPTKVTGYP